MWIKVRYRGQEDNSLAPLLERLAIDPADWFKMGHSFGSKFAGHGPSLCQILRWNVVNKPDTVPGQEKRMSVLAHRCRSDH